MLVRPPGKGAPAGRAAWALLLISLVWLAACAAPPPTSPPAEEAALEIVAQSVAYGGGSDSPILLALSGDAALSASPEGFPPDLTAALQAAAAADPTALYVVIYAGKQPGGGFSVAIDSVKAGQEGALTVVYSLATPDPKAGGTTALTYPYVVARVHAADADPAQVQFSGPF